MVEFKREFMCEPPTGPTKVELAVVWYYYRTEAFDRGITETPPDEPECRALGPGTREGSVVFAQHRWRDVKNENPEATQEELIAARKWACRLTWAELQSYARTEDW